MTYAEIKALNILPINQSKEIVQSALATAHGGGVAGVVVQPTVTHNGNGTITVGAGTYRFFNSEDFTGTLHEIAVAESTIPMADNTNIFLVAHYNDGDPVLSCSEDSSVLYSGLVVPVDLLFYNAGDSTFSLVNGNLLGNGYSNKKILASFELFGLTKAFGLEVEEFGTRNIRISAGVAFLAQTIRISREELDSTVDQCFLRINNGDGTYTKDAVTQYPNTQWDDKSGTLQDLTDGNYGVIWVWESMAVDTKRMHFILGNGDYTLEEANVAPVSTVPAGVSQNSLLTTKIVVLKGASTATSIEDVSSISLSKASVTDHGALTGKTGGHSGVYDHLPIYKNDGTTPILVADRVNGKLLFGTEDSNYDVETDTLTMGNIASPITNYLGNGVISGFTISINADNTKIDVGSGLGNVIDNTTPATPVWTKSIYAGATGVTLTNLATANATYLAVNSSNEIVQQTTPYTPTQRSTGLIIIGVAVHSNRTNVNVVNNLPDVVLDMLGQFNELLDGLHSFNISGNRFSANGTGFTINKSTGSIFKRGCNFEDNPLNPHAKDMGALTAPDNIRYRLQDGTEYADTDSLDHLNYDLNGVKTAVPNHKFTVQRIVLFSSNIIRIQYGQTVYDSEAEAIQGIEADPFVVESNIDENGLLRAFIVLGEDFVDGTEATFIEADKFGETSGGGAGSSTTTLQQAYDNSIVPQITGDLDIDGFVNPKGVGNKLMKVSDGTFETAVAGTEYYSPDQHGSLFGTIYRKYIVVPDNTTAGGTLTIPIGVTPTALLNIGGWVLEHTTNRLMPIPNASGASTDPRGIFAAIDGSNLVLDANNNLDWDSGYAWFDYTK